MGFFKRVFRATLQPTKKWVFISDGVIINIENIEAFYSQKMELTGEILLRIRGISGRDYVVRGVDNILRVTKEIMLDSGLMTQAQVDGILPPEPTVVPEN